MFAYAFKNELVVENRTNYLYNMQNTENKNLIQVKLDVSIIQDVLSETLKDIYSKLTKL